METNELKECLAVAKPSMEEELEYVRTEIRRLRMHCGRIEQENTVLQRLYTRYYDIVRERSNAMEECNERADRMHLALYSIRNLLLSHDTKSRITKDEREELISILNKVNIHCNKN